MLAHSWSVTGPHGPVTLVVLCDSGVITRARRPPLFDRPGVRAAPPPGVPCGVAVPTTLSGGPGALTAVRPGPAADHRHTPHLAKPENQRKLKRLLGKLHARRLTELTGRRGISYGQDHRYR
ncbi:hypothetical protein KRMM14A1259_00450 [Krasilnikovia sp. MM14-A1259]